MTALEKLNALQAGGCNAVLQGDQWYPYASGKSEYMVAKEYAAKVEVTKVVLNEYLDAYDDYYKDNFTLEKANRFADAFANLIQLKETL